MSIYVTKTVNKTEVPAGGTVTYTYTFHNDTPDPQPIYSIEDNQYGVIWQDLTGGTIVPANSNFIKTYDAVITEEITNKGRANWGENGVPAPFWTEWSNEVTVRLGWKDISQAINTKEDAEVLNALTQGGRAWQEDHALRCVKMGKIIDLI